LLQRYGALQMHDVRVMTDSKGQQYAFVNFQHWQSCNNAIQAPAGTHRMPDGRELRLRAQAPRQRRF